MFYFFFFWNISVVVLVVVAFPGHNKYFDLLIADDIFFGLLKSRTLPSLAPQNRDLIFVHISLFIRGDSSQKNLVYDHPYRYLPSTESQTIDTVGENYNEEEIYSKLAFFNESFLCQIE